MRLEDRISPRFPSQRLNALHISSRREFSKDYIQILFYISSKFFSSYYFSSVCVCVFFSFFLFYSYERTDIFGETRTRVLIPRGYRYQCRVLVLIRTFVFHANVHMYIYTPMFSRKRENGRNENIYPKNKQVPPYGFPLGGGAHVCSGRRHGGSQTTTTTKKKKKTMTMTTTKATTMPSMKEKRCKSKKKWEKERDKKRGKKEREEGGGGMGWAEEMNAGKMRRTWVSAWEYVAGARRRYRGATWRGARPPLALCFPLLTPLAPFFFTTRSQRWSAPHTK